MNKVTHNLSVKVDSYMKGNEQKNKWLNVGVVMQNDDGSEFILLDRTFNPAGVINPDNKKTVLISKFPITNNTPSDPNTF